MFGRTKETANAALTLITAHIHAWVVSLVLIVAGIVARVQNLRCPVRWPTSARLQAHQHRRRQRVL